MPRQRLLRTRLEVDLPVSPAVDDAAKAAAALSMADALGPYQQLAERLRDAARRGSRLHLDADQTRALLFSGAFELVLKLEIAEMLGKPTPYPPAGRSDDASPAASGDPSGAYSVTSLAKCWGVSTTMVYEEIRSGRLEAFKLGGKLYRIRKETVEAYEAR